MNGLVLQLWVFMVAGWINRSQQNVIEYLLEENSVLREHLGGRKPRFTDAVLRSWTFGSFRDAIAPAVIAHLFVNSRPKL